MGKSANPIGNRGTWFLVVGWVVGFLVGGWFWLVGLHDLVGGVLGGGLEVFVCVYICCGESFFGGVIWVGLDGGVSAWGYL